MNASIICIKTTDRALFPLTKCQPRNCCSPDSNDTLNEGPVSGHYTHLSAAPLQKKQNKEKKTPTKPHTHKLNNTKHLQNCQKRKKKKREKGLSLSSPHHSNPSEAMHALADGGQVVEEWRGAVLLTEIDHLLDHTGNGAQELRQVCLKIEQLKDFTHMVNISKFHIWQPFTFQTVTVLEN